MISRRETRKACRTAKKQQQNAHRQAFRQIKFAKKPAAVTMISTGNGKAGARSVPVKHTPLLANEDDDEEISSDFEYEAEKQLNNEPVPVVVEKKRRKSSSSAASTKAPALDFMDLIDEAYAGGKLTSAGFVDESADEDEAYMKSKKAKKAKTKESKEAKDDVAKKDKSSKKSKKLKDSKKKKDKQSFEAEKAKVKASTSVPAVPVSVPVAVPLSIESATILKQIQSLINKLSPSNLIPIATDLETIFKANRRKEVIELLTRVLLDAIIKPGGNLLDSFALSFAALAVVIQGQVGMEFGAHLIEKLIESIDSLKRESCEIGEAAGDLDARDSTSSASAAIDLQRAQRSLINCINFCSFMYNLQLTSSTLIIDLIKESIAGALTEIDVEIILKLVRTCGQQLKRDSSEFMKEISSSLAQRLSASAASTAPTTSSRFKFMIETINDLKDSKRKLAEGMTVELDPVKKAIKAHFNLKMIGKPEPLRISLQDVRDIEVKGKWWLIGSSWHPSEAPDATASAATSANPATSQLHQIDQLAKAQRMNTKTRKSIFTALLSSEDYSEAFETLVGMKLSGKEERDVVLVLVHCCAQERQFNPFYALLASKLCHYKHNFITTFQYLLWDSLKELADMPLRKKVNLARLYGNLIGDGLLPLSALRKATFFRLDLESGMFWQVLFHAMLLKASSEDEIQNIGQGLLYTIAKGKTASNNSVTDASAKKKVTLLTANTSLTEFDDEFFAAQEKLTGSSTASPISQEKLEECRSLRGGLCQFLKGIARCSSETLPFKTEIELFKSRCQFLNQILQKK